MNRSDRRTCWPGVLGLLAFACATLAAAADAPPAPWRDRPFYPGYYATAGYESDPRDSVFDPQGMRAGTAMPTIAGKTSFPETQAQAQFSWYFPLFAALDYPYVSTHLFVSRIKIGYQRTRTQGSLQDFIATNPDGVPRTDGGGGGFEDATFEWGSFIVGGRNWRDTPVLDDQLSVLALIGFTVPTGSYHHRGPISPGDNTLALHARLGAQWQPWAGGSLDGGVGYRLHNADPESAFGRLAPEHAGSDVLADLSLTQRLVSRLYVTAFASGRQGSANRYVNLAYAPNAAPPPTPPAGGTSRSFPTPGVYFDQGTGLVSAGATLHFFIAQNWLASLSYQHPVSGKSGQFLLPFTEESCQSGGAGTAPTCTQSDGPVLLQDGAGSARSFASDSWMLSLSHKFDDKDVFPCRGCD